MKQKILSLIVLLYCGVVWAQNTTREPIQGSAANPVTQHEAEQDSDQKPLSELIHKKKKKPKTTITAEPTKPSTDTTPSTTTPQDDTKTSTPSKK